MPSSPTNTSGSAAPGFASDKSTPSTPGSIQDQAAQSIDKVKADASALKTEAQNLAGSVADEASAQVSHITDEAKAQATAAVEKAKGFAGEQKDLVAGQIEGVADAMQRVASDLEANSGTSAQYARMVADNAEKLSSTIKNNDVDALLTMTQDFGRRQPAAFVGVAALLGFAASRFLLASGARASKASMPESSDNPVASSSAPTSDATTAAYSNGRL